MTLDKAGTAWEARALEGWGQGQHTRDIGDLREPATAPRPQKGPEPRSGFRPANLRRMPLRQHRMLLTHIPG
ncbi:hypothetical protein CBM2589_A90706 [Cupriavidus taiwanensis]|uniref:Uncharacterized protein n=1 Tax=Cupriavidus taiwanensis TaxID=164546 RepID=A0A375CG62_9BURK|nr:hypothetical protein CBM2589_A90706 [Cupriavidus taiwanensis]